MTKLDRRLTALSRIVKAAEERYVAQSAVRGKLQVPNLTEAERIELSSLFGEYVRTRPGETLKLALKDLERALQEQAISADLPTAIAQVTGHPVETKSDRAVEQERRWVSFTENVARLGSSNRSHSWTKKLLSGLSCAAGVVRREFQTGYQGLLQDLRAVACALDELPADYGRTTRLPVFAREITGNPHGFDEDQRAGRLLVRALTDELGAACGLSEPPQSALERGILLTSGGLLPDGISSSVAAWGLKGAKRRNGGLDQQVEGTARDGTVLIASLRQVSEWESLITPYDVVFAVENPPVFEELVDSHVHYSGAPPLLCTSGFLSVAAIRVLDLAVSQGLQVKYGGDFDVKGLTIAEGLVRRYGGRLRLWGMAPEDYRVAASHERAESLSDADINRLGEFARTPLAELAAEMQKQRKRAYQEAVLSTLQATYGGND